MSRASCATPNTGMASNTATYSIGARTVPAPVSLACVSKVPRHVAFQCAICTIVTVLTGMAPLCPIALCSTQLPQSQPQLASECCWGLLLAHDLLLW